ncbi:autotransporter domain-containing protein [Sebaldella termitidis]|uniref:autotransporter domain-containing protein n=1 Tax=Sebaldella termitidis TaxID=826 RepID=UPI003EBDF813
MKKYAGIILYIILIQFTCGQSIADADKKNYENRYKLVEQLLKEKQKELEDLYKQGDFIVKPEYLSYQVFFSAFYGNSKSGKSSYGKDYENPAVPIPVNFGILIPMKEIKPEIQEVIPNNYNYAFTDPESIKIGSLELLTVKTVDIPNFDVEIPNIQYPVSFGTIDPITVNVSANTNGYTNSANSQNLNTNTQTPANTFLANGGSQTGIIQIIGVEGTNVTDPLGGTGSVTYVIAADMESQRTGGRIITMESHRGYSGTTGATSATGDLNEALFLTTTGNLYINSENSIGIELERGYSDARNDAIYINKGLIESGAAYSKVIGIDFQGETLGSEEGPIIAENRGIIRMNGDDSIGINSVRTPNATGTDLDIGIKNTGLIEINGDNSYGIFIGGKDLRGNCNKDNGCPARPANITSDVMYENLLVQNGTININGENGVGVVLKDTDSLYNVKILNNAVLNEAAGVININNKNSVGIYADGIYDNSNVFHGEETNYYNNGTISLNSLDGIGIRVDYSGIENAGTVRLLSGAVNSIGMAGTDQTTIPKNSGLIEILNGGSENIGIFVNEGNAVNLENGIIKVEAGNSSGILAYNGAGENKGSIFVSSNDSAGIIADNSTININGGLIENSGNNMAIFGTDSSVINLNAGLINTLGQGVSLYLNKGTAVNLKNGFTINVNNESFMLYSKDSSGSYSSVLNTDGISAANIKNGGFGFYYDKNTGTDAENFLRNTVSGTGILNLNMEKEAVLIFLDETTVSPQFLSNLDINLSNIGSALKINGSGYYNYGFNKVGLIVDKNINLDNPDDTYLKNIYSSSDIDVNTGIDITGSKSGQIFIIQANYDGSPGRNAVTINNNGNITLSGNNSAGILADFGEIYNNAGGAVNILGSNSKALVSLNGTAVFNDGVINIGGADSAGIYGSNNFVGVSAVYGNEKIEIHNSGVIQSVSDQDNIYGIYSINEKVPVTDARVILTGSSRILLENSENSVGIFLENSTLNGSGIVEVGNEGIGLYGHNSVINLNNFTMNLSGNNALGFYLRGNTVFNAAGGLNTININGTNNILYYFTSDFNGSFNQDFIVNSTPGSTYMLGVIKDMSYLYNGTANLGEGGIFVYGTDSSVTLGVNGHLESQYDNVIGIYLDGVYTTAPYEALNTGSINLEGNNSAGIYLEGGARALNDSGGVISMGTGSAAIYGNFAGDIKNSGEIYIKDNSSGIYTENSGFTENNKLISGNGNKETGIYSVNSAGVLNSSSGEIRLTGDGNVGIYNISSTNTQNDNMIFLVSGGNSKTPGIGIYSDGSISNTGNINVYDGSVGIYAFNGNLVHSGIISSGDGGIGIYADNETVSLNIYSYIKIGNNAVGVYGKNNTAITANGSLNIGTDSFGYVLESGTKLYNSSNMTLSDRSVFAYSDSAAEIINNIGADIFMDGQDNTAFYMVNGGKITNNADITGIFGTSNVGIYNNGGSIENNGNIKTGDSALKYNADGQTDYNGAKFVSDSVKFKAPYFDGDKNNPVLITPDFAVGTNALVYKLKDVFNPSTKDGGPNYGIVPIASESLTWRAVPVINNSGNLDIWMEKIAYAQFTAKKWYAPLGGVLDKKYEFSTGESLKIFDSLDIIKTEDKFQKIMENLSGNIYANMNKREKNTADIFQDSLELLQASENNTKENIKVNIIAGKTENTERQKGITGYDSTVFGGIILREIERTYYNTVGYSAGYLHTATNYADSDNSTEDTDTLQAGVHSRYNVSQWTFENDFTGRISFHNVKRNIEWEDRKSVMNGEYQSYSFSSINRAGYKINNAVMPYAGFRVMYVTRPGFGETGTERLQIEGNDAWSVKPGAGIELKGGTKPGKNGWVLKGLLDIAYEYELADLNVRERAKLTVIEDNYRDLVKPDKEKGVFKSKITVGAETGDKFGIFLTGSYEAGAGNNENYRIGINLKAAF